MYLVKRNNHASYLKKVLTIFNKIVIQTRAEIAADKYVVGYRDSKCTNLSVYCPYQEIVCFVPKH